MVKGALGRVFTVFVVSWLHLLPQMLVWSGAYQKKKWCSVPLLVPPWYSIFVFAVNIRFKLDKLVFKAFVGVTFTLNLADAFIQSDVQGCIHILHLHWGHTAHQEQLGVQCLALKDASTGNRTSNLLITKRLLYLLYHCRPPVCLICCGQACPCSYGWHGWLRSLVSVAGDTARPNVILLGLGLH